MTGKKGVFVDLLLYRYILYIWPPRLLLLLANGILNALGIDMLYA